MVNGGHDQLSQKFLQIKQDDKFFSRLLSKETSRGAEASFRVLYYGGSSGAAVPFMWESQPGTPKHPLSHSSLPPLTPPPSYQSNKTMQKKKNKNKHMRSSSMNKITTPSFLTTIFASKKCHVSPSLWPSSSSTSSSSFGSFSSPSTRSSCLSNSRSSTVHFGVDDDHHHGNNNTRSSDDSTPFSPTMCFGARSCGFPKGYFWSSRSKLNANMHTVNF